MQPMNNPTLITYNGRYPFLKIRKNVWQEIVRFVQKDAGDVRTLLELGAGYCDFINQFPAKVKIGYDMNPEMKQFAAKNVDLRIEDATGLNGIENESVDLVFASNFMEHLDQDSLKKIIQRIRQVLRIGGSLILIQPNYRLCTDRYFEDETHQTIFTDILMRQFLESHQFSILKLIPGVLPFSMKTRIPKWPVLVRLYLLSPFKPLAAQMYVVAKRT